MKINFHNSETQRILPSGWLSRIFHFQLFHGQVLFYRPCVSQVNLLILTQYRVCSYSTSFFINVGSWMNHHILYRLEITSTQNIHGHVTKFFCTLCFTGLYDNLFLVESLNITARNEQSLGTKTTRNYPDPILKYSIRVRVFILPLA